MFMFWIWFINFLCIVFGLVLIIKTEFVYNISWYANHNVDKSGKEQMKVMIKFSGWFMIIATVIWSITILRY